MLMAEQQSHTVSFPNLRSTIKDRFAIANLSLRPFGGCEEDLEIDFNQPYRPNLETQILECCTRNHDNVKLDQNFFWSLEIGKRTEFLLIIATLEDKPELIVNLRCLNPKCQQVMEIIIAIQAIIDLQRRVEVSEATEILIGNINFSIRRPTGNDQQIWLNHAFLTEISAIQNILETLILDEQKDLLHQSWEAGEQWSSVINQNMEDFDPLVNFTLLTTCPFCGAEGSYDLDLGAWALGKLHQTQRRLIETVHRLASHYHWSEREIFAIPSWRRFQYLKLIDHEEN
jgi:hypothetical protein